MPWYLIRNRWVIFTHDLLWVPIALGAAFWLRFNLDVIPPEYLAGLWLMTMIAVPLHALSFWLFGCYRGVWRFASIPDLMRLLWATGLGALSTIVAVALWSRLEGIPRSAMALYPLLLLAGVAGARVTYRAIKDHGFRLDAANWQRALIVGAGRGGEVLVRDLHRNGPFFPAAVVDDDPAKQGIDLHGVRVRGSLDDIEELIDSQDIDIVLIAMPSASRETMNRVVNVCAEKSVACRTLPSIEDLADGTVTASRLRPVTVEDLLGREPVELDNFAIDEYLENKRVLVTGGGGSIGSELCRQISAHNPAELLILDNSEYNLYGIEREFCRRQAEFNYKIRIGDVRNRESMETLFREFRPQVVFHAAAYKHVPMVELNPEEGVRNNVFGTMVVADCADKYAAETFVLISTDKTVNPTNIMGATKRVAELYCQNFARYSKTHFVTTRFGNVLASAGSVVPLFEAQIAQGGPVTVTHPDVTRYFMTMTEAASLILQAGAMGQGGEIFVMDMGQPVRIQDLAEKMIRLSGLQPGTDVAITHIGLRPGEKLHEELFYDKEELRGTAHPQLMLAGCLAVDWEWLNDELKRLADSVAHGQREPILANLTTLVPEFKPQPVRLDAPDSGAVSLRLVT